MFQASNKIRMDVIKQEFKRTDFVFRHFLECVS